VGSCRLEPRNMTNVLGCEYVQSARGMIHAKIRPDLVTSDKHLVALARLFNHCQNKINFTFLFNECRMIPLTRINSGQQSQFPLLSHNQAQNLLKHR
jgi:hypothetical protein